MVAAALAGAVFTAIGIVVRQRATMDVPPDQGVSAADAEHAAAPASCGGPAPAPRSPGIVFQAVALAYGSLLLVAPLLVSALLFALPLSARLSRRRVTRAEWGWAMHAHRGAGGVRLAGPHRPGDYEGAESPPSWSPADHACWSWRHVWSPPCGSRTGAGRSCWPCGVGVLFGVVAVLTKIGMHILTEDGAAAAAHLTGHLRADR